MNLWVRSQDREGLLKINDRLFIREIANIGYSVENDLCIDDGFISLGIYKTKERALEILDEIQSKIEDLYALENCSLKKNSCIERSLVMHNFNIYQMPKE